MRNHGDTERQLVDLQGPIESGFSARGRGDIERQIADLEDQIRRLDQRAVEIDEALADPTYASRFFSKIAAVPRVPWAGGSEDRETRYPPQEEDRRRVLGEESALIARQSQAASDAIRTLKRVLVSIT